MKKWQRNLAAALLFGFVCSFSGAAGAVSGGAQEDGGGERELSAWVAYWDMDRGIREFNQANESRSTYGSISYFAAYFNDDQKLFIPEPLMKKQQDINGFAGTRYLTVVNDVQGKKNAGAKFKDIGVVKKVLKNPKAQQKHADDIVKLAQKAGCSGIDLDYERVFRDKEAAKLYLQFIAVLYEKAQAEGLQLRVILEPNVDFSVHKFPKGPQYVVMLYNLYGTHSGEGPKADFAFIRKTADKMKSLPGTPGIALAAGGCLWSSSGEKKFISEQDALSLARRYKKVPERSLKSNALRFSYKDDAGIEYTVWYADELTLTSWMNKAKDAGISDICIWRLGGSGAAYTFAD